MYINVELPVASVVIYVIIRLEGWGGGCSTISQACHVPHTRRAWHVGTRCV